jgi:CxxC motif-containing protein (DUF1111 family)
VSDVEIVQTPKTPGRRRAGLARVVAPWLVLAVPALLFAAAAATEAPAGFFNQTNGFEPQAAMDADRAQFEKLNQIADGLGPVFNAQGCVECHGNPVSGGISQIAVMRAGSMSGATFTNHPGGSLVHDRAIDASIQQHISPFDTITTLRTSNNGLGDGFVEAIADSTLLAIQAAQPVGAQGTAIQVPVLEAPGVTRIGRFGWKDQHASLISFSADAYLNEIGVTNPLFPTENTSDGTPVTQFNTFYGVPAIQDPPSPGNPSGDSVGAFARFLRSTMVPPRATSATTDPQVAIGANIFTNIVSCGVCHTPSIVTAPVGTSLAGGTFVVPAALGNKVIHPYSDFLLHDVGTGDGIVQNGGQATANMLRTPPLWGMRTRSRLMHDGLSLTPNAAIQRHAGQANASIAAWTLLTKKQKNQLLRFLLSL